MPTQTVFQATSTSSSASPTCTTVIPDKYGYVPPDSCNANYGFYPQWEDNTAFAVAFGLSTVAHLVQAIILKKSFCWVIVMGALWECVCFILRALGARDQQESTYMIVSTLLLLLAPLWINAFAYMTVARLVHFLHPRRRLAGLSAQWLAKCFVAVDVLCFIIQAAGGAMLADQNNSDTADLGRKVYMAGVGVQLGCVLIFLTIHTLFYREISRNRHAGKHRVRSLWTMWLLWVIYVVLALIVVRIIFRLVEFSQGASSSNVILRHEEFQLYLDALPMLIAVVVLNVVHPGMVLQGPESSFPSIKTKWWHGRSVAFETLELSSNERS
ncbi:RTA1 like protein-domain-containing protein [Fusarium solani]|uniref:RTA1 like protein-domain-containing protein n=1 Tax=Fusarium solani TaxID=169388 RepID=A0A9P9R826_FUSSL|nr:RTA1 like protein-domain-containing protein [Fusarium solani]KAH7268778.1 RTA1 like protein-domain-containing protein [Fusarium solani]